MKYTTYGIIALCIGLMLSATSCIEKGEVSEEIAAMNTEFLAVFNSGDIGSIGACYTEDARIFPQNREGIEGRNAITLFWEEIRSRGIVRMELLTKATERSGNISFEEGRYSIYTDEGKEADLGKYLSVWKKEKGVWKIHRSIWNTSHSSADYYLPDLLK